MDLLALDLNKECLLTILRVQLGSSSFECISKQDKPIASQQPKTFAHSIGHESVKTVLLVPPPEAFLNWILKKYVACQFLVY
jgi:hypothetical protein